MRITCEAKDFLDIDVLTDFQGGLKSRSPEDIAKIQKSIQQYGFAAPFFVWFHDGIYHVLDGHGRLQALKDLQQHGEHIPPLPVVYIRCQNEAEAKNILLRINSTYGAMSSDSISEFIKDIQVDFDDICLPIGTIDLSFLDTKKIDATRRSLRDIFLVPVFSVLDTRVGYWQDRKRQWKSLGLKSEEGRDVKMLENLTINARKVTGKNQAFSSTSIFDPVLAEVIYTWFCMPDGNVLDPFAGGSVRGIVASYKQLDYTGFDIRAEQIAANEKQRYICDGNNHTPQWICADSAKMNEILQTDDMFDLIFSCPPYADLEKYSDIAGDISNMDYPQFLEAYREIIKAACSHLKDNRFAVFVVGEVRNKKTGAYYNFVSDTIQAFRDAGLTYYNELILINVISSKAYASANQVKDSRKIAKVHQNIIVFVKGSADEATKAHENVLVFLKGNGNQAASELGDIQASNCVLPEFDQ